MKCEYTGEHTYLARCYIPAVAVCGSSRDVSRLSALNTDIIEQNNNFVRHTQKTAYFFGSYFDEHNHKEIGYTTNDQDNFALNCFPIKASCKKRTSHQFHHAQGPKTNSKTVETINTASF